MSICSPSALARARRDLADEIYESRFGQFLLSRQGNRLKEYAHERGIFLIGDLPFFVSLDSSDVWAHPECFLLDANLSYTLDDGSVTFSVYGKNLTNEFFVTGVVDGPSTGSGTGTANGVRADQLGFGNLPRTVRVELTKRF